MTQVMTQVTLTQGYPFGTPCGPRCIQHIRLIRQMPRHLVRPVCKLRQPAIRQTLVHQQHIHARQGTTARLRLTQQHQLYIRITHLMRNTPFGQTRLQRHIAGTGHLCPQHTDKLGKTPWQVYPHPVALRNIQGRQVSRQARRLT